MLSSKIDIIIAEENHNLAKIIYRNISGNGCNIIGIYENSKKLFEAFSEKIPHIVILNSSFDSDNNYFICKKIVNQIRIPVVYIEQKKELLNENNIHRCFQSCVILPFNYKNFSKKIVEIVDVFREDKKKNYIIIKEKSKKIKIFFYEIVYLKSNDNYVEIITTKKKFIYRISLQRIYESLDKSLFLKTHRSYIINVNHAKQIIKNKIYLNNISIPISRKFKNKITSLFDSTNT